MMMEILRSFLTRHFTGKPVMDRELSAVFFQAKLTLETLELVENLNNEVIGHEHAIPKLNGEINAAKEILHKLVFI